MQHLIDDGKDGDDDDVSDEDSSVADNEVGGGRR